MPNRSEDQKGSFPFSAAERAMLAPVMLLTEIFLDFCLVPQDYGVSKYEQGTCLLTPFQCNSANNQSGSGL